MVWELQVSSSTWRCSRLCPSSCWGFFSSSLHLLFLQHLQMWERRAVPMLCAVQELRLLPRAMLQQWHAGRCRPS